MTNPETIPLTEVSSRLIQQFGHGVPYLKLYQGILDGKISAERDPDGRRWRVRLNELHNIADSFGIPRSNPAGSSKQHETVV